MEIILRLVFPSPCAIYQVRYLIKIIKASLAQLNGRLIKGWSMRGKGEEGEEKEKEVENGKVNKF